MSYTFERSTAMRLTRLSITNSVDHETVRSVSKLLLAVASLIFVLYLLTLLPGVDRLVPATPISFIALVGAIVALAVVALLLILAPKVATLARMSLDGPENVVENVSSVIYWLVILAAVLVGHRGLAGIIVPFLDDLAWVYDVVFLLLALPAVAFIAARLYDSLDPSADLIADRIVGPRANAEDESE